MRQSNLSVTEEKGEFFQPDILAEDRTGTINETVATVLEGKHPHGKNPSCATLETYQETPMFIPVDIMEEAVNSVARKFWGILDQEVQTRKHYRDGL